MVEGAEATFTMLENEPESVPARLKLLRETLERLERHPDPYFDAKAHEEFKYILKTKIALLERIEILEADAARTPAPPSGFRVQVYIRGVEIQSCK